jgi:hypothetical protein
VDIAQFHKLNQVVLGHLKNDLKAIQAGIVDGSIPSFRESTGGSRRGRCFGPFDVLRCTVGVALCSGC